jgi:hypothetical protein
MVQLELTNYTTTILWTGYHYYHDALIFVEDFVVIVLAPPNVGLETREFPVAINVAEVDGSLAMCVSFVQDFFQLVVLVFLVCYTHLIVASHFAIARPNPFARADEMLRLDPPISEEVFV